MPKCPKFSWSFEIALNMFGKIIELHVFWIVFCLAFFDVQFPAGRSGTGDPEVGPVWLVM
jgi:hypothetical protein